MLFMRWQKFQAQSGYRDLADRVWKDCSSSNPERINRVSLVVRSLLGDEKAVFSEISLVETRKLGKIFHLENHIHF